ncbi:efflux RND transporter periplasmic adaptor subunit [Vibrio parahaemolyticus]|nr:efflux RND transporter periplasmic adaptor subunit [Vibrio parahaemolyticus]
MKKNLLKGTILVVCIALFILSMDDTDFTSANNQTVTAPLQVTVLKMEPTNSDLIVTATGVTLARWPLTIKSAVSGRVLWVDSSTDPGQQVDKSQLLLRISPKPYQVSVSNAKAKVARAEFELENYQHQQYVANRTSGGKTLSSFGKFEPHIKTAQTELSYAMAELNYSEEMLNETKVTSPYNSVIVNKLVTPSQWVESGEALFDIMSSDYIDVRVELSELEWNRLKSQILIGNKATVLTSSNDEWTGEIRYLSPVLDSTTRQRSLVLTVEKPYASNQPLLPKQFVNVIFKGETLASVVEAPSSVLTTDGKVWTLENNLLILEDIELIEENGSSVKFKYVNDPNKPRLLVRFPLSSMLEGQVAEPKMVTGEPL